MTAEENQLYRIARPNTRKSLVAGLRDLGLEAGVDVLVHSSLSKLGWVCGGASAVVEALMEVITESGTLVMPAHTSSHTEPSRWSHPPVPESWWPIIRAEMPAFDCRTTPTEFMGAIAETFRSFPGVIRSQHPAVSFCAWGRNAELMTKDHSLEFSLGENSPLAKLYELNGSVLLLGAGHDANTSLHLSEIRSGKAIVHEEGAAVLRAGKREWVSYRDYKYDSDDFAACGAEFEKSEAVKTGAIGLTQAKLMNQRDLVDFGLRYFQRTR